MAGCGGSFMTLDGDFATPVSGTVAPDNTYQGEIHQQITDLMPGKTYDISFFWGGGQQAPRAADTLDFQLLVGLCASGQNPGQIAGEMNHLGPTAGGASGSCGFYTPVITAADHGFTGWEHATNVSITATAASETLSFLALGTPAGVSLPPMVLLDGVSATEEEHGVPEPGTWSLLLIGFAVAGVAWRRPKWRGVPA